MKIVVVLAMFLLLVNIVIATEYSVDFILVEGKALVETNIIYDFSTNADLALDIPQDAKAISLYLDEQSTEPFIENNKLIIKGNVNEINFEYLTKEILGPNEFLVSLSLLEADTFTASLTLPEGATLAKPIEEETLSGGSVFPKPDLLTTDGQRIKLIWERFDVEDGDDFSLFVQFKEKTNITTTVVGILVIIAILLVVIRRLTQKKEVKVETKVKETDILKHLKEEEETVINVLKQREGQCEQGTLRVVTGFPKATLSRILKELEDRKIIYKEKRGKKNLVFLKE